MERAYGDWTRRQSAAVETNHYNSTIDPRISERQQLLERILQTTRWPTKNNVADVDPEIAHHFTPIQQPGPVVSNPQLPLQEEKSNAEESKIEVSI